VNLTPSEVQFILEKVAHELEHARVAYSWECLNEPDELTEELTQWYSAEIDFYSSLLNKIGFL
jgi:hypothetical protein